LVILAGAGAFIPAGALAARSEIADMNYMAFVPLVLNQQPYQLEPYGELKYFTPI
jgi:hypothetical protein